MSQEAAFLQAVLDDPDDDAPRLVYADWLEDHGEAECARFIRAQCQLAKLDEDDPARRPLLRDEWAYRDRARLEMAQKKRPAWLANVPKWAVKWLDFERGFPSRVRTTAKRFVARADELMQALPVQSVVLTNLKASINEVARCEPMAKLRSLDLSHNGLTLEAARPLLASPHVRNLTQLRWRNGQWTAAKMRDFAASLMLANLRALEIGSNSFRDTGTEELLASPHLGKLESLDLTNCNIGKRGAKAIADTKNLPRLRRLNLSSNSLSDKGGLALAASRNLDRLTTLDVAYNEIGPLVTAVLLDPPGLPALRELHLGGSGWKDQAWSHTPAARLRGGLGVRILELGNVGAKEMIDSPVLAACRSLVVVTGDLREPWVEALASSAAIAGLEVLHLGWGRIGPADVRSLARSPHLKALRDLDLSHNPLTDAAIEPLLEAPWLRGLTRLNLRYANLTEAGALRLARSGTLDEIAEINLSGNDYQEGPVYDELRERFGSRVAFM